MSRPASLARIALLLLLMQCGEAPAVEQAYRLAEGESRVVAFRYPVDRVLVTNPDVATVKVLNSRELLLTGHASGEAQMMIWQGTGAPLSIPVAIAATESAAEKRLHRRLRALIAGVDPERGVRVAFEGERAVLTGTVPNAARVERLEGIVEALGLQAVNLLEVKGSQQVQLQVRVAEVVKGNPLRSGVTFLDKRDRFGLLAPGTGTATNFLLELDQAMAGATLTAPHGDAFRILINPANASLFGLLNLLEGHNLARVLAQPTLVVESGKSAKFLAGGEVPIPIAQDDNTVSVDYKEFGVMVEFSPRILDDGVIALEVKPEVSNIDETAGIELFGIAIPGFRTRRTETSIRVRDGESFVVGGLLQDEIRSAVQSVPLLGDIPVLGALFRSSAYEKNQSELAIIVTPRIVQPIAAGESIPLPGEGLDRPSTLDAILFGKLVQGDADGGLEMPQ